MCALVSVVCRRMYVGASCRDVVRYISPTARRGFHAGRRERDGGGNTKGVTLALGHWADACRPVAFWQLPLREVESGGG